MCISYCMASLHTFQIHWPTRVCLTAVQHDWSSELDYDVALRVRDQDVFVLHVIVRWFCSLSTACMLFFFLVSRGGSSEHHRNHVSCFLVIRGVSSENHRSHVSCFLFSVRFFELANLLTTC